MRDVRFFAKPHYSNSHALVIGIDQYVDASPLSYAVSDARAVRDILVSEFDFPHENVTLLENAAATRDAIRRAFFRFTKSDIGLDDRILIFFAGHGDTVTGARGEVGYLVPHDADLEDLSTYVSWADLTSSSEQVRSKHILFVMDACYGGLALTRNVQSGSARFLKDMMLRYSRQVLTAGKADEVVADSGGPIPDHSVFTGHFLEALQGKAAGDGGVITASSVMAYVYNKVANDKNSNQTPHYGHFDGDGDFVFKAPGLSELEEADKTDDDQLLTVPYTEPPASVESSKSKVARVKSLIPNPSHMIELHDVVIREVRQFQAATSDANFSMSEKFTHDEFISRLERYEASVSTLSDVLACLAHWANPGQTGILQKSLARSTDQLDTRNGLDVWLSLRWYPLIVAFYEAGIAALEAGRYDTFAAMCNVQVPVPGYRNKQEPFAQAIATAIVEIIRTEVTKTIPGHERNYTPLSEYLFKLLQPKLDDLFFVGKGYEDAFDKFEVLFALVAADINKRTNGSAWGPIGRFGWKARSHSNAPLATAINEAKLAKSNWPPLANGLFDGDYARFEEIATEYGSMVGGLPWH